MDIRELADQLNAWLLSKEGSRLRAKLRVTKQEIVLYDERLKSGYRKLHFVSQKGLVGDFFPAATPSRRGEESLIRNDFYFALTDMWETGKYASLEALGKAIKEKLKENETV